MKPLSIEEVLGKLSGVKPGKKPGTWTGVCPVHQHGDRQPSLSVKIGDDGVILLNCFGGCTFEEVCSALDAKPAQLMGTRARGGIPYPPKGTATLQHPAQDASEGNVEREPLHSAECTPEQHCNSGGLTIRQYAEAKKLPLSLLGELGLYEITLNGKRAVAIPYQDASGTTAAVRFRLSLDGEVKFKWRSGSKTMPYGLRRLPQAREQGFVILVEGESNCHTLWAHGYPAVGIPGANTWKDQWADELAGIERIFCVLDPDRGGEAVRQSLAASSLRPRTLLVRLNGYKDVSEVHLRRDGADGFEAIMKAALANAGPLEEVVSREASQRSEQAWEKCAALAQRDDILLDLSDTVARAGVAGEQKLVQLLYLALTSRLTQKPVPVAIVGPSAGGKNHVLGTVLEFMPPRAYYALSSMSEHALAYSEEPLDHRFLVIYELAGLNSDFGTYLLRSLLSEGQIAYETVEKSPDGILRSRRIEREGPTGLILTTTRTSLHPDNATRMLTVAVTDTPEQTAAVLRQIARGRGEGTDFEQWQALQTWLEGAEHRVAIPYAEALAAAIPPVAVRLRRDFGTLLSLVEARAILHQVKREHDTEGRIVADLSDYAAVRELVLDVVGEGVEASVSATVRATVGAVESVGGGVLAESEQSGVTLAEVAKELDLDRSSTYRRVKMAVSKGYLTNLETRRGRPGRFVIGDPMPDDRELLPSPEVLQRCMGAQTAECNTESPTLDREAPGEGVCTVAPLREGILTPPHALDAGRGAHA